MAGMSVLHLLSTAHRWSFDLAPISTANIRPGRGVGQVEEAAPDPGEVDPIAGTSPDSRPGADGPSNELGAGG